MVKYTVVLPEELHDKVRRHVEDSGGRYVSISEVVRKAVWTFLKTK